MAEACQDISTDVTAEEAHAVLEPYFLAARQTYETAIPSKLYRQVRLEISEGAHDTPRHFAGCSETGKVIVAAPEMVELGENVVMALFLHEFGHATDFLFPGKFMLVEGELEMVPEMPRTIDREDKRVHQLLTARLRQWERRGKDAVEITADKIAELASGLRIGYRGPCMLQHLNSGRSRPRGLR